MYLKFFGLSEKPFSQTPDPRFLYWNDSYREALASLRYGIQERKGFLSMIGEAGTGKTTLLRKLLDDLGPDVVSVFLFNPNASFEEILEYTLSELGVVATSGRKLVMLQRLNEFLLGAFAEGKNTVLVIDEAQDLETEVLESLRLLSNLETSREKILQIVLSGQPELGMRLAQENLRQLKQRLAVRCRLEPLKREELAEYIRARLRVAGGDESTFEESSLEGIWRFANGIPRLVNTVCDNALLVAYAVGKHRIDGGVVEEVVHDLSRIDSDALLDSAPLPMSAPVAQVRSSQGTTAPTSDGAPAPEAAATREDLAQGSSLAAAPAIERTVHPGGAPPQVAAAGPAEVSRTKAGTVVLLAVAAAAILAAGVWLGMTLRGSETKIAQAPPALPAAQTPRSQTREASAPLEPKPPTHVAVDEAHAGPAKDAHPQPTAAAGSEAALDAPARLASANTGAGDEAAERAKTDPERSPAPPPSDSAPAASGSAPAAAEAAGGPTGTVESPAPPPSSKSVTPTMLDAGGERVLVRNGDTLYQLAWRAYGSANPTTLDMLRAANPTVTDVNRILAGSTLVFPDPGPQSRVLDSPAGPMVLVVTTHELSHAQGVQRKLQGLYGARTEIEPVSLGEGQRFYRVFLRDFTGISQARAAAEAFGSILLDPNERPSG